MSSRLATSIKVEAMNSVSKQQCIDIKYRFTLCNRDSCHKPKPLRRANAAKQRFCQSQFIREILPIGSKQACNQVCFSKESVHGTLKSIRQNLTSWEFTPKTQGLKLFLSIGAGKTPQIVEVVTSSRRVDVYIKCFYLWVTFPVNCWKNRKNQLGICRLGQWRNWAWWTIESTLSVDESSMQG